MEGYLNGVTVYILITFNLKSNIDKRYLVFMSTGGRKKYMHGNAPGGIQSDINIL